MNPCSFPKPLSPCRESSALPDMTDERVSWRNLVPLRGGKANAINQMFE